MRTATPETTFAIAVDGEAVGSVGFVLRRDVERVSAEIGYWLAEPFWGRGIATEALAAVTGYAIAHAPADPHLRLPFAWNARVVPGAGKGRLRARGAAAPQRDQGRRDHRPAAVRVHACPSTDGSSHAQGRLSPRGDPKPEAEALVLRRVRVAQRAARAVGVEVPAAAANHALLAGRRTVRVDVRRAASPDTAPTSPTSTPTRCRACRRGPTGSAETCRPASVFCRNSPAGNAPYGYLPL